MQTAFRSEERFTQAEFWDWLQKLPADDIHHYELINGQIVMTPPAGYPHEKVIMRIIHALLQHVVPGALGEVLGSSAGYDFPSGNTLEPDVVFISAGRLRAGPKPERGRFYRIVPDLVVEVLSRSTAARDRTEKKEIYARDGVREYWIVDSRRREVTVFYSEGTEFSAGAVFRDGLIGSRVLPGLVLATASIFAEID